MEAESSEERRMSERRDGMRKRWGCGGLEMEQGYELIWGGNPMPRIESEEGV